MSPMVINILQGPGESQHGSEWRVGPFFSLPWPQSICQRDQERELWPLFPYAPPGPTAGDPEVSLGGALGVRQVRVQAIFLLGLGETSSFVSHPSYKTCGFLAPQGGKDNLQFLLHNLLFPLAAIPGWRWALLLCLACMRKVSSPPGSSVVILLAHRNSCLWCHERQSSANLCGSRPTCLGAWFQDLKVLVKMFLSYLSPCFPYFCPQIVS